MLPFKLVYHARYDLNLGVHVFPSQKFRLIHEMLFRENIAAPQDFLRPEAASDEDILRVHTGEWVRKLKTGMLTASDVMKLEVPYSPELVEAVWLAAGGSILAAQSALRDGFGSNLGGGFHHAYPGHGEGFCAIHDVAVAIRKLQADGTIKRAMVVDTDVHQIGIWAADFTTRIRGTEKDSARFTTWRWQFESCRRMARSKGRWSLIRTCIRSESGRRISPRVSGARRRILRDSRRGGGNSKAAGGWHDQKGDGR